MQFIYVSSVVGSLVPRYSTLRNPVIQYIGAVRTGKTIAWFPQKVVAIPESEWVRYRREYRQELANGTLKARTEVDYKTWLRVEQEQGEAARAAKQAQATGADNAAPEAIEQSAKVAKKGSSKGR